MQTKTQATPTKTSLLLRALIWLAERDRRYRERCKLRDMPGERLRDMGISRQQADAMGRQRARSTTARGPQPGKARGAGVMRQG